MISLNNNIQLSLKAGVVANQVRKDRWYDIVGTDTYQDTIHLIIIDENSQLFWVHHEKCSVRVVE